MSKTISETEPTIEALLEQRTQYEEWLARLDASGDKVPPVVRQRVRGDYESRLRAVLEQLRGRGASVAEELERQHATQAQLDQERRAAEEALAEAEVRHAVGEYSEDEWRRLSEESRREIDQLRGRLRSIGSEITRLTEVQALVAAPRPGGAPAPAAAAAPVSPPARIAEVVEEAPLVTHVAEPIDEAPAARPAAKSVPEPAPVDELAFLKSVSDEDHRPATRRPSNPGMAAVSTPTQRVAEPVVAAPAPSPKAASGVAKTLKCGECGTLNRPTEWYCERCGAELAGV